MKNFGKPKWSPVRQWIFCGIIIKKMKIYEPELHTHTRGLGSGGGQDVLEY